MAEFYVDGVPIVNAPPKLQEMRMGVVIPHNNSFEDDLNQMIPVDVELFLYEGTTRFEILSSNLTNNLASLIRNNQLRALRLSFDYIEVVPKEVDECSRENDGNQSTSSPTT